MTWYVLSVSPQREIKVEAECRRIGMATCVPYEKKFRKARGKQGRPELIPYRYVVMPGYVFLSPRDGWLPFGKIKGLDHVRGFIQFDGRIATLSGSEVDRMQRMFRNTSTPTPRALAVGDRIKITDGPFAHFESVLKAIGIKTATVTVQLFGRENDVTVLPDQIERAA